MESNNVDRYGVPILQVLGTGYSAAFRGATYETRYILHVGMSNHPSAA